MDNWHKQRVAWGGERTVQLDRHKEQGKEIAWYLLMAQDSRLKIKAVLLLALVTVSPLGHPPPLELRYAPSVIRSGRE